MMVIRVSGAAALYLLAVLQYSSAALVMPRSQLPLFSLGKASAQCGICEIQGRYACLDEVRYGFCFGETAPDPSAIRTCPTGKYCSLDDKRICVDIAAGAEPSCSDPNGTTSTSPSMPTGTPETTTEPPFDDTAFCYDQLKPGYVAVPNDPTCKEYIYCYVLSGQLLSKRYVCNDFFNPITKKCQKQRPEGC